MSGQSKTTLYSPQMLALAVELAHYPFRPDAPHIGDARSSTCGSTLAISFGDRFSALGMNVTACAVGQASAAIFARHCEGKTQAEIASSYDALLSWLAGDAPLPDWPDLDLIAPARDYPARHGAILLPWKAALDALSSGGEGR